MNIKITNYKEYYLDLEKNKILKVLDELKSLKTVNLTSIISEINITIKLGINELNFLINFLKIYNYIKISDESLTVLKTIKSKNVFVQFAKYYFNLITNNEIINKKIFIESEIQIVDDFFLIKVSSIELGFRKILITLGKLNLLKYEGDYVKVINYTVAKKFIERSIKKLSKSQKEFDKELYEKKLRGDLAEKYVLDHEIEKLKTFNLKPIRQSIEDIGLGYDILSFKKNGNEIFIEVKSIINNTFYWSKNEINISKEYNNKYFIYCVQFKDNKPEKIEKIIQNPYDEIFIKNNFDKKSTGDFQVFLT
jgi:hypothetical protein